MYNFFSFDFVCLDIVNYFEEVTENSLSISLFLFLFSGIITGSIMVKNFIYFFNRIVL